MSERGEEMAAALPFYVPSGDDSNNFKLLDAIGSALESVDSDVSAVDAANTVQTATTIDQLWELAKLVDLPPESNETVAHYRTRILVWFKLVTAEGTISDIMDALVALMPDLSIDQITYTRTNENGYVLFEVPQLAIDSLEVSHSELSRMMNENAAAGFRIAITYDTNASFTYRTETEYNNTTNDTSLGYDELSGGVPTNSGGTYAAMVHDTD
jgi:hypothetical protein